MLRNTGLRLGCRRIQEHRRISHHGYTKYKEFRGKTLCASEEHPTSGPLEVSTAAINSLMQAISVGDQRDKENRLELFLEYVPDALLDKAIEAKKGAG